ARATADTRPKISRLRNASQLASTALAELGKRLGGKLVELAAIRIPFDLLVEAGGIEFIEPGAKFREVLSAQKGNCPLDFFEFTHFGKIARKPRAFQFGQNQR